jgi:hypothetical protein
MKITRRGARADHGQSSIEFPSPSFSWVKNDSTLTARQNNVRDFSTTAHHGYAVKLSISEINELLNTLAVAAAEDPALFEKNLEPSLKALLQLQHVVSGVKTAG